MNALRRWVSRLLLGEWEAHYDYCDVFEDSFIDELTLSSRPCSEDCANHPGVKVLLNRRLKEIWFP